MAEEATPPEPEPAPSPEPAPARAPVKKMSGDGKGPGAMVYRYAPSSGQARIVCTTLVVLLLLAGITALVLYLVYRPSKPHFTVIGAAVYQLTNATNALPANAISTSMQFTVVIRNPNERATIAYDRLSAYVSYKGQPITPPAPLPPLLQERDSTVSMSPLLGGGFVPVAPEVAGGLATDQAYGVVSLRVVLLGRIKYKTGPFRSAWVGMFVRCDLLLGLKKGNGGQAPLLGAPECDVDT